MIIDPTTDVGRLRMRVADVGDISYFPDNVYVSVLADNNGNLPRAAKAIACFILGILSQRVHKKLAQIEIFGAEAATAYKEFLLLTFTNPNFMDFSPLPYSKSLEFSPILQFQADWNKNFSQGTEAQQFAVLGTISPNEGDLYGPISSTQGWQRTYEVP